MPEPNLFTLFISRLNKLGVRYMVSGSVASAVYGEYRSTNDVDIVVWLLQQDIERLVEAFPSEEFYCPPAEIIRVESLREQRGQFNIIHLNTGMKADIYLTGRDSLNTWGFARCKTVDLEGEPVVVAPPEVVIVRKLEFFREGRSEKHVRDIRAMLEISPELKDSAELKQFIQERGLDSVWQIVLGEME